MSDDKKSPRRVRRLLWRRRIVRALALVVALPLLLLVGLLGYLHTDAGEERLRKAIVARAAERVNGRLALGGVTFSLFDELALSDLEIHDAEGREVVRLSSLRISLAWGSLLRGKPTVERLALEGLTLTIVQDAEGSNLRGLFRPSEGARSERDLALVIEELIVADVALRLHKPDGTILALDDFGLEGRIEARPSRRTARVVVPRIGGHFSLSKPGVLSLAVDDFATSLDVDLVEGAGRASIGETRGRIALRRDGVRDYETELKLEGFSVVVEPGKLEASLEALFVSALALESLEVRGGMDAEGLAGRQDLAVVGLRLAADTLNRLADRELLASDIDLSLAVSGPPEALELRSAIRAAGGAIDITGIADVSNPDHPRYAFTISGSSLDPAELLLVPLPPARLEELRIEVRGHGRSRGDLDLSVDLFLGSLELGAHRIAAVSGSAAFDGERLEIAELRLDAYEQAAIGRATLELSKRRLDAHLTLEGDVGQALDELRAAGVAVDTRLPRGALRIPRDTLTLSLEGAWDGRLRAHLAADRLAIAGGALIADFHAIVDRNPSPGPDERAFALDELRGTVALEDLKLASLLALRGKKLEGLDARLSGRLALDGAPSAPRLDYDLRLATVADEPNGGRLIATLAGRGDKRALRARLRIDGEDAEGRERLARADLALPLTIGEGARGIGLERPWEVEVEVPERRMAALARYLPKGLLGGAGSDFADGTLAARISIAGTPAAPEGTIQLSAAVPLLGERLQRLRLAATVRPEPSPEAPERIVVGSDIAAWLDTRAAEALEGHLRLTLSRSPLRGPYELGWDLDLEVPPLDLATLPVALDGIGGTAGAEVHLTGTRSDLSGGLTIGLAGIMVRERGPLDATIALEVAADTHLTVSLGSGGTTLASVDATVERPGRGLLADLRDGSGRPLLERLGRPAARAVIEVGPQPIAAYSPLAAPLSKLPGTLTGRIDIHGELAAPRASGELVYDGFETIAGGPGRAALRILADEARLGADLELGIPKRLELALELPREALAPFVAAKGCWRAGGAECSEQAALPITLRGGAQAVPLEEIVPAFALAGAPVAMAGILDWSIDGRLVIDPKPRVDNGIEVPAIAEESRLDGALTFSQGTVSLLGTKRRYRDVAIELRHDARGVSLDRLVARESDPEKPDRRLSLRGRVALHRFRPGRLSANLSATDWLVFGGDKLGAPDAPRGSLSAEVAIRGDLAPPIKRIDVRVAALEVLIPDRFDRAHQPEVTHLGDVIVVSDEQKPGKLPVTKKRKPAAPPAPSDPKTGLDVHVAIPKRVHILQDPLNLYATGAIDVRIRGAERTVRGRVEMVDGDLALGGKKHALQRGHIAFDERCPAGCMDLLFGRKEHNATLRDLSRASGGDLVTIHMEGPLDNRRTTLGGAGSPGTLFDLLSVHNVGRQRYLAQPDMPASLTVEYPQHDNLLLLSYLSVNVPHMLFLDKMAAWADAYDGRGTASYGRIEHYEAEGYSDDGDFRVRAVARPRSAGQSEHELSFDYLFSNTPNTAAGIGLSAGDRLGGGPGIFFEWSSED